MVKRGKETPSDNRDPDRQTERKIARDWKRGGGGVRERERVH